MVCTCCTHPDHAEIDAAIVAGESVRSIGSRFGVSPWAVSRHHTRHMSPALVALQVEREQADAATARAQLENLIASAQAILDDAMKDGRPAVALQAVAQLRPLVETLGKVTGEWAPDPLVSINLLQHPEGQQAIQIVLAELADQPDVRRRIAERLQLEAGPS